MAALRRRLCSRVVPEELASATSAGELNSRGDVQGEVQPPALLLGWLGAVGRNVSGWVAQPGGGEGLGQACSPKGRLWLPPAFTAAAWAQFFYNLKMTFLDF